MTIQVRRGLNSERATITPLEGELIYTTDTKLMYVGDGITLGGNQVSLQGIRGTASGNINLGSYEITGQSLTITSTGTITATSISGVFSGSLGSDLAISTHNITNGSNLVINGTTGVITAAALMAPLLKISPNTIGAGAVLVGDSSGNVGYSFSPKLQLSSISTLSSNYFDINGLTSGSNTTLRLFSTKSRATIKARYVDKTTEFIDPSIDIGSLQIEAQTNTITLAKSNIIVRMEDLTFFADDYSGTGLHIEDNSLRMTADGNNGVGTYDPHYKLDVRGTTSLGDDLTTNGQIFLNWSTGVEEKHSVLIKPRICSIALSSSSVNYGIGDTAIFTVTLSKKWFEATPITLDTSGTVSFYSGTVAIGTATISSNVANLTINTRDLALGTHSITAVYEGDNKYLTITSPALSVSVTQHTTTVAITVNTPTVYQGNYASFGVAITPNTATGTVTFSEGANTLGTATITNGYAYFQTVSSNITTGLITAAYSGDSEYLTSNASTSITINSNPAITSTTTALVSSTYTAVYGTAITLTATVSPSNVSGTVDFLDGFRVIGTGIVAGGVASLVTVAIPVGTNSITARYCGDNTNITSVSSPSIINISENNTTTTLSTGGISTINYGETVMLTATVSSSTGTPKGSVDFNAAINLGTATLINGVATLIVDVGLSLGSNSITAVYNSDSNYATSTSTVRNVTVLQNSTVLYFNSSRNTSYINYDIVMTATVSPATGNGVPTGSVTLYKDRILVDTASLTSGIATFTITGLDAGLYRYSVSYAGDVNFIGSSAGLPEPGPAILPSVTQTYDIGSETNEIRTLFAQHIIASNFVLVSSKTGGIGYSTGAGGTVTQQTSKETTVVLNAMTGTITLNASLLGANSITHFTFTNSAISGTDMIMIQHQSGGTLGAYTTAVTPGSGTAIVYISNNTLSALSEPIVLRFVVIKSVNN